MSERGVRELLEDIIEAISRIQEYLESMNYRKFAKETKTQDAVVRNLEIIGEAVKKIPSDFKAAHNEIPWKKMAGLRDVLIHDYFGVNLEVVWAVATENLPPLLDPLRHALKRLR
ncbi:MAG: DUF86 domain-containing protein [Fibrobacterota bacterium]